MDDNGFNIDELLAQDEFGLLDVKPQKRQTTPEQRLVDSFIEIVKFYEQNGRKPDKNSEDVIELKLGSRLYWIERNAKDRELLRKFDKYSLIDFNAPTEEPIADLNDEFDLLSDEESEEGSIFDLKHVPGSKSINMPDYVGRAKICRDFDQFKELLENCQRDIKQGDRALNPFRTVESIKPGAFFVDRGVLVYVAEMEEPKMRNDRKQARLRCILDSGQETDILNFSLAKNLYNGGKIVSHNINDELKGFQPDPEKDQLTGYVYVLKSQSKDERIKAIKNLYKTGFCTTSVDERIKNAMFEPTYLMAKVQKVANIEIYNVDPQKFEKTLHDFFDAARVSIVVHDTEGSPHTVREWFQIPLGVIKDAIARILEKRLDKCHYDRDAQSIIDD